MRGELSQRAHHLVVYLASQFLSQATNVVRGLIVPNLLGPAAYGLVATVNAVDRYTPYVSGGVHYYILNRLPVTDSEVHRERLLDTMYAFTLLTSAASALVVLGTALLQIDSQGLTVAYGVVTLGLNAFASGVWRLHSSLLRVDERIPLITRLANAQTLVSSVLIVGLTWTWGIVGTFTAQLTASAFILVLVRLTSPYRFRLRLDWGLLRSVLVFSVPVFLVSGVLLATIDTTEIFVIAHRLGTAEVGVYAFCCGIAAVLFMWTNGLTTVYSTPVVRAVHGDGLNGGRDGVRLFTRLLVANSLVFVGLCVVAYVFLPVVVQLLFPGFSAGLGAARLLVVSAYYENISVLGLFVLTAQRRFNTYLVWLALLVVVLIPVLWWIAPRGIVWVALLAIARRLVKAHVVLAIGVRHAFSSGARFWTFCAAIYLLGLAPLGAGWLLDLAELTVTRQTFLAHAPQLAATFAMVVPLVTVPLYALQRRYKLLEPLWSS
jgi:O-antigen/teichoic acid export membrane protein